MLSSSFEAFVLFKATTSLLGGKWEHDERKQRQLSH